LKIKNIDQKGDKKSVKLFFVKKLKKESYLDLDSKRVLIKVDSLKDREELRLKSAKAVSLLNRENVQSVTLPDIENIDAVVEGILLSNYQFLKYKSKPSKNSLSTVYLPKKLSKESERRVQRAIQVVESTNYTKDLINSAPNEINPTTMVKVAKELSKELPLEIKVLSKKDLKREGMNLFLAVGRASVHSPAMVKLSHKPKKAKKRVLLVGKGLTYDSGGLSLKPSSFMETMKSDKSGASAVLGVMRAVSKLNLNVEVHGYLGIAENMVNGDSFKPDDVIKGRNGVSVEIKNTDAEGRLVLADTLSYAQDDEKNFDIIIDIATLTGAAVVAVGEYTSLVMGHSNKLKNRLLSAGKRSGELIATLPFNRYLEKMIESPVADIANIGNSRYGGALTAGLFLDRFIKKSNRDKWLHLDIAGPAYVEKSWGYNQFGASGAGVRAVVELLESL
jgi:leucyl aminopeptidase